MKLCGRAPTRNLLLDGFEEVADFMARQIKLNKIGHTVHVSESGAVRLTRVDRGRKSELPEAWKVGEYPYKGLRVEWIEDDLLERVRELTVGTFSPSVGLVMGGGV